MKIFGWVSKDAWTNDPTELGKRLGRLLENPTGALKAIASRADAERIQKLGAAHRRCAEQKARLDSIERRQKANNERSDRAHKVLRELEEMREKDRSAFSVPRALLYLTLAVLTLIADLPIVGEIMSKVLGVDFRSPDGSGMSFPMLFLTQPLRAYQELPALTALSLAVLSIGFFTKTWLDELEGMSQRRLIF